MANCKFSINVVIPNKKKPHTRRTFTPESQARYGHRSVTTSKNKEKDTPIKHGYHLEDYERQCVYLHYYDNEDKPFYVGQGTIQRAFVLCGTRRNDSYNKKAIDINKIRVEIVAIDITPQEGVELETELIKKYKFDSDGGSIVNIVNGGRGGKTHSTPVIQYNMSGEKLRVFNSIKEACDAVNGDSASIAKCCKNNLFRYSCKGYRWSYLKI